MFWLYIYIYGLYEMRQNMSENKFHTDRQHVHTHYTVGGKCIHHQHTMDAGNTLREFDALKQAL